MTAIALYILSLKIDLEQLQTIFSQLNIFYFLCAFLLFNLSKIISAIRLNLFFKEIEIFLSELYNMKLYYLGMFYNLFLPGGIGGDGYKVYLLNKLNHGKVLTITKAILLDRVSGLVALSILCAFLFIFSSFSDLFAAFDLLAIVFLIDIYPISFFIYKRWLPTFVSSFRKTNIQALYVQIFQLLCALFIILALNISNNYIDLLTIFFISSVVATLPFTIGGVGARELTFVYLLQYSNGDINQGVALSILFFLITALSSLLGAVFINSFQKDI